jgi:NTE family protein
MLATSTRADIAEEARRKLGGGQTRTQTSRPCNTAAMDDAFGRKGRALVLGGGGVAGIAWEIGLLARLAERDLDLAAGADLVVGTSAGATVGALVTGPDTYETMVSFQRRPVTETKEQVPALDTDEMAEIFGLMVSEDADRQAVRRRIGSLAKSAATVPEAERRRIIASRLPVDAWPDRPLVVTAVDADSGDRVAFDRSSGASLVDAVAASCAVPGIWPPVTIGSRRYVDGGVYSVANEDLADGYRTVVALFPIAIGEEASLADPEGLARMTGRLCVVADAHAQAAFGPNVLDPASRAASLDAGMEQADRVIDAVRDWWEGDASSGRH